MTAPWLRFRGALAALPPADRRLLLERPVLDDPAVTGAVAAILERVRREGDAALRALAREHDGVEPAALEVPRARATWRPPRARACRGRSRSRPSPA